MNPKLFIGGVWDGKVMPDPILPVWRVREPLDLEIKSSFRGDEEIRVWTYRRAEIEISGNASAIIYVEESITLDEVIVKILNAYVSIKKINSFIKQ